jgi:hypothetical protein
MFSVQEIIITCFYVHAAYTYLQGRFMTKSKARNAMFLLLVVQLVIIALDIAVVGLDLLGHTKLKVFIHSFVYSVKLELEFVILNQLIELSRVGLSSVPPFCLTVVDARVADQGNDMTETTIGTPKQSKVASSRSTSPSTIDLESGDLSSPTCTLDFITTPQHMSLK